MVGTFAALADPNRLRIVGLLRAGPRSVNDIGRRLRLAQPQVSKHLRTLRGAGLVAFEVQAPKRLYALAPARFDRIAGWLAPIRAGWERHLDALGARLDDLPDPPPRRNR